MKFIFIILLLSISLKTYSVDDCGFGFFEVPENIKITDLHYGGFIKFKKKLIIPNFTHGKYEYNKFLTFFFPRDFKDRKIKKGKILEITNVDSYEFPGDHFQELTIVLPNFFLKLISPPDEFLMIVSDLKKKLGDLFQICQKEI